MGCSGRAPFRTLSRDLLTTTAVPLRLDHMPDVGTDSASSAAPPAEASAKPTPHPEGSVKDTVESILVAFILAFVFRAFVVEAFVIPTGSMAPTLLGAHMHFACDDCGYKYAVNYPTGGDLNVPNQVPQGKIDFKIFCPNCGHGVKQEERDTAAVHYGDRILVLKYRYLFAEPQRWDVVVFKAPDMVANAPRYTTNYIKRLIGTPGESVMIVDGDIYVSTANPPVRTTDDRARSEFLKTFAIQGKPKYAQDALWRLVHDNDFLPHLDDKARQGTAWKQPWQIVGKGSAWNVGQDPTIRGRTRVFGYQGQNAETIEFNPEANPNPDGYYQTLPLTDFLAYDQVTSNPDATDFSQQMVRQDRNVVTDLKLSLHYVRDSGDGPLTLLLTKQDDHFTAHITPGKVELVWKRSNNDVVRKYGPVEVPALGGSGPVALDFANVDYRVSLRVNDREVISTGEDYRPVGDAIIGLISAESASHRTVARPRIEVTAERQSCRLEHVSLWRDLYYVNSRAHGRIGHAASPDNIMVLGPDEYFVMGDNPWISSDARGWQNPVNLPGENLYAAPGRVPGRFLLGKAFFVYWPAGYRPPVGPQWGLIPNFGEMRFIH